MRVSEAPQQGRPKGAERLHMAFHGMFTEQDAGAFAPRADKPDPPTRCSVVTGSTRASGQSSKTPNVLRRSVQASSTHDRVPTPADPFASPIRGSRKASHAAKSPVAPHSVSYANRHTNRPVYTAVGISTPTGPRVSVLRKSGNPGLRAATASLSPPRHRMISPPAQRPRPRQPQQQQPTASTRARASPARATQAPRSPVPPATAAAAGAAGVGSATSAVIAALAMDAALPQLDPTAMALLETIMGGAGAAAASPPRATPAGAGRGPSPLGPATVRRSNTPSPLTAAAAAAVGPAPATVLTHQLLQQHQQQYTRAALRQQHQHALGVSALSTSAREPAAAASLAAAAAAASAAHSLSARPAAAPDAGAICPSPFEIAGMARASQQPPLPSSSSPLLQAQSPFMHHQTAAVRPQSPTQQVRPGGAAGFASDAADTGAAEGPGAPASPMASPLLHREHHQSALPTQPLLEPPSLEPCSQPQQPLLAGETSLPTSDPGASCGGEESLQARTSRMLARACDGDSPPARRVPVGSQSVANMQPQVATTAAAAGGGSPAPPASPGSRTLMKRLCRSHATGTLSTKMLRSPKDQDRRPVTYAELQGASKPHHQLPDQPSSPLPQPDQPQPAAHAQDRHSPNGGAQTTAAAIITATAIITTAADDDQPDGLPHDEKAAAAAEERLSGPGTARTSPYGRCLDGLLLPETICERGPAEVSCSPAVTSRQQQKKQQQKHQTHQQLASPGAAAGETAAAAVAQRSAKATPAKRGLFSGLFACFGFGSAATARDEPPAAAAADTDAQCSTTPTRPSMAQAEVLATPPPAAPASPLQQLKVMAAELPPQAAGATTATSTVAAVAAALAMSPTSAAAHAQSDSRLLMLLRNEMNGETATAEQPALVAAIHAPRAEGGPTWKAAQQEQQTATAADGAKSGCSSPCTPRAGAPSGGNAGGFPSGTPPVAAAPWPSKSPVRQPPGMMPASPDGPVDALTIVTRSPVGHLRYEDGDSVLRGSVDVHPSSAAASCLSFSPARPPQQQPVSRACSGLGALPRAPRQPLQSALDAAAAVGAPRSGGGGASGRSALAPGGREFLEPPESGREPPSSPRAQLRKPAPSPAQSVLDLSLRAHNLHGADTGAAASTGGAAAPGVMSAIVATPPAPRSSRKRSRATHACGGGALSQLDARKLAAMPLEEMLEQIQAAIAAEDLATGRTTGRNIASAGGLSDDGSLLPMPSILSLSKQRSGTSRRRKSTAGGGGGRTAGHHSGGGGGGGPSRGGRSSDGGTRGGAAAGVGAVHTTLMKAAAATAALGGGSGRRRRRTRGNRSPPKSTKRKPPHIAPPTFSVYGSQGQPVSPNSRKSDGAGSYGLPVWRHGGRAMAFNGLGIGGVPIPTITTSPPRSAANDSCFSRQPPYKKPQLCTPTPASMGGAAAGGGNVIGGSPPHLRQSAPSPAMHYGAAAAPAAGAKTPMPVKTPGVVHTHVRAARRLIEADDGAAVAPRPMAYTAALMAAAAGAGKAATPTAAAAAKRATAGATAAAGPITSSLNISDLMSRIGIPAVKTAGAVQTNAALSSAKVASPRGTSPRGFSPRGHAAPADLLARFGIPIPAIPADTAVAATGSPRAASPRVNATAAAAKASVVANAAPSQKEKPQQQPQGKVGKSSGGVGASTAAVAPVAVVVVPSLDAALRPAENRGGDDDGAASTHGSPQLQLQPPTEGASSGGSSSSSGESTPHRPRIVSVSLTELLQRAAGRGCGSASTSSGGGDDGSTGEDAAPEQQQQRQPSAFVAETDATEDAPLRSENPMLASRIVSASASEKVPEPVPRSSAGRLSSTGGAGISEALLPHGLHESSEARVSGTQLPGGGAGSAAAEPARASIGYLELLQAAGGGGRTSAPLPHYAMPIASRATSAGGNNGGSSSGGGSVPRSSAESCAQLAAGGESPVRTSLVCRHSATPAGGMRLSLQSVGSYAQLAALRSGSGTVAVAAAAGKQVAALPAVFDAAAGGDAADGEAGDANDFTPVDAASTTASPAHGPVAAGAVSPTTSSVVAQLPSACKAAEAEGLASTAAVRSGGVRLLEDTADSSGACAAGEDPQPRASKLLSLHESPNPEAMTARCGDLETGRDSTPDAAEECQAAEAEAATAAGGEAAAAAAEGVLLAGGAPPELLLPRSSGSLPVSRERSSSSLTEPAAEAEVQPPPPRASPLTLALPATPQPSVTPFADWRCVPLAAYEASLTEYDAFLGAPTESDRS